MLSLATVAFAAMVHGTVGFAFGLLSMAVLSIYWGTQTANVVVSLLGLYSCAHALWSVRQAVRWQSVGAVLAGVGLGLPLGTLLLVSARYDHVLRALVAVACLVVAVQNWQESPHVVGRRFSIGLKVLVGALAGFLSAAISSPGPVVIWYAYRQPGEREELKAAGLLLFTVATFSKLVLWVGHDCLLTGAPLFTRSRLVLALALWPMAVLGTQSGVLLFKRVDRVLLRRLVCGLLAATGGATLLALARAAAR